MLHLGIGITTTSSRFNILDYSLNILDTIINQNNKRYQFFVIIEADENFKNENLTLWNKLKTKYKKFKFINQYVKSIAKAKNVCINELKKNNCDYYLMFDDDCFVVDIKGIDYYVEACKDFHFLHLHLDNFRTLADNKLIIKQYKNFKVERCTYPCGCFIIFDKLVVEKTGGWNNKFIGWGFEHGEFERRTVSILGLKYKYLSIPECYNNDYFISLDALKSKRCNKKYNISNLKFNSSKIDYDRYEFYEFNSNINKQTNNKYNLVN